MTVALQQLFIPYIIEMETKPSKKGKVWYKTQSPVLGGLCTFYTQLLHELMND